MAVISSKNRTCASASLLELYRSPEYILTTSLNCLIAVVSLLLSIRAIRKLCSQSIIQYSPRILLIATILFSVCHQIAYFRFKIEHLYNMLFKLDDPCNLQHTSYDCRFVTIAMTTGNCGLAFIQFAMSIDRMLALLFPVQHSKLKSLPGVVLSLIVFTISFSTWFVLTIGDSLTGWVNHCGFLPTESVDNFDMLLEFILIFTLSNFILDIFVLRCNIRRDKRWRHSYDVTTRYESRVSVKCTQAIFLISICQFVSNALYAGLMWLLMLLGQNMSSATYSLSLSIIYASPYTCTILPLIICKVLNYIKEQRKHGITSLLSQKQSMEEHMSRIRTAWK